MTHWLVATPVYTDYGHVYDDPPEPPETGADCVYVDAPTRRAAKVAAVRKMTAERMDWVRDQRSDKCSPFTGLKVEPAECEHGFCWCDDCTSILGRPSECLSCIQDAEDCEAMAPGNFL